MNVKKLFPEKKITRKGLLEFLDKKGFYIVLILCIAIVGVTAVFLSMQNVSPSENNYGADKVIPDESDIDFDSALNADENTSAESSVNSTENAAEPNVVVNATPSDDKTIAQGTDGKTEDQKKEEKPVEPAKKSAPVKKPTTAKISNFVMPVFGEISFDFAQDKLVYSKTLEEWRTHSGIDIAADRGTPVKAVAGGIISEIKNDPRLGITIIVDHQNSVKTVYSNLASDEMVVPNQRIEQGEVIGSVGNTAAFESAEQTHLHFEVLKNNEPVDPTAYLPKK